MVAFESPTKVTEYSQEIDNINDIVDQKEVERIKEACLQEAINIAKMVEEQKNEDLTAKFEGLGYENMKEEDEYVGPGYIKSEALSMIRARKRAYRRQGTVLGRLVR